MHKHDLVNCLLWLGLLLHVMKTGLGHVATFQSQIAADHSLPPLSATGGISCDSICNCKFWKIPIYSIKIQSRYVDVLLSFSGI